MTRTYTDSRRVEKEAIEMVLPLLNMHVRPGSCVLDTHEFEQSEFMQRKFGDFLAPMIVDGNKRVVAVEIKGEQRYTKNLFVETWSNRRRPDGRQGWIYTLDADVLMMVYLEIKCIFSIQMGRLWEWCFEFGNLFRYREVEIGNHQQKNKTCGRIVPFADLMDLGVKIFRLESGTYRRCKLDDVRRPDISELPTISNQSGLFDMEPVR